MPHVELKKKAMLHMSVTKKPLCPLLNDNVTCHYRFSPYCRVSKSPCHILNLRNGYVSAEFSGPYPYNVTNHGRVEHYLE